jgi:hypothetical protein
MSAMSRRKKRNFEIAIPPAIAKITSSSTRIQSM